VSTGESGEVRVAADVPLVVMFAYEDECG